MDHIATITAAADKLREAIEGARAAGYRVDFPMHALTGIGISETRRLPQLEAQAEPVTLARGKRVDTAGGA
jgi:hypothetical protein